MAIAVLMVTPPGLFGMVFAVSYLEQANSCQNSYGQGPRIKRPTRWVSSNLAKRLR